MPFAADAAGWLVGKIERLDRTVAQDFLSTLPFYTDGSRDAAGRLYEPGSSPLGFERFAAEFQDWVEHYNTARPHAELAGETPLERWKADPTPVRAIPPADLRFLLLAGAERRIIAEQELPRLLQELWIEPEWRSLIDRRPCQAGAGEHGAVALHGHLVEAGVGLRLVSAWKIAQRPRVAICSATPQVVHGQHLRLLTSLDGLA